MPKRFVTFHNVTVTVTVAIDGDDSAVTAYDELADAMAHSGMEFSASTYDVDGMERHSVNQLIGPPTPTEHSLSVARPIPMVSPADVVEMAKTHPIVPLFGG